MRPGSRRKGGGGRVVIGKTFRGTAGPRGNIVPYEAPKADPMRAKRDQQHRISVLRESYETERNKLRAKERFG